MMIFPEPDMSEIKRMVDEGASGEAGAPTWADLAAPLRQVGGSGEESVLREEFTANPGEEGGSGDLTGTQREAAESREELLARGLEARPTGSGEEDES